MRIFIILMLAGFVLSNNLWADHEPDHRYSVQGFVLDGKQHGSVNLTVQALSKGIVLGSTQTNSEGYYSLHLHLHDTDYDSVLTLRAGPHTAKIRVNFDVGNTTSARIHLANFIDGQYVEGKAGQFQIPTWSYVLAGLILIIVIAFALEKRRKKKIRLAKYGPAAKNPISKHKAKKIHRKHH